MPASYSFSPQFATIKSESPLAGMRPVISIPEVKHTALSFKADEPFKIRSSGEELVGLGAIEGVNKGVGAALEGITTAYVSAREAKAKKLKEDLDRGAAETIANIRAKGSKTDEEKQYEEDLKTTRLNLLKKQLNKKDKEDNDEPIVYGDPDAAAGEDLDNLAPSGQGLYDIVNPDVYPNDGLEAEPIGWSLDNLTGNIGPTPQEVQNLWSKPLSELTAATPAGAGQAAQLATMQAGQISVPSQDMSTDVQAQVRPLTPAYDLTAKYKGLVSPEQAQGLREQFYKATGEQMTGLGQPSLANMPTPVAQARKEAAPQATTQNLGRYLKTFADPEVAFKAQEKINEIMGSNYAPAEIEEITTKTGERGFKVKYPKKLSAKEIADLKKSAREEAGAKKEKLQQFQLQSFENVNRAQGTLDDLEKQLDKVQDKLGPISGRIMAQNPYDTDVQLLNKFLTALIPTIARGVYGEVGVLTEADINNYKNLIPNITQDPANAKATLAFLKRDIQRAKEAKLNIWEASNFDIEGLKKFNAPAISVESNLKQQIQSKIKELQSYPANSEQRLKAASELNALRQQLVGSK